MFRFICVFAMPRTGSSHLMKLLTNCKELNIKGELFHPSGVHAHSRDDRAALRRASLGAITDRASLCRWRSENPRQTLEVLYQSGGGLPIVFKLFPAHLSSSLILSDLFSHNDVAYIVLRRRPIDSYISGLKAKKVGTYGRIDTTTVKPTLKTGNFVFWCERVRQWYDWLSRELEARNLPHTRLSYDEHLNGNSNKECLSVVLRKLSGMGFPSLELPPETKSLPRQDREADVSRRVANWQEFKMKMESTQRHAQLLEWATRTRKRVV